MEQTQQHLPNQTYHWGCNYYHNGPGLSSSLVYHLCVKMRHSFSCATHSVASGWKRKTSCLTSDKKQPGLKPNPQSLCSGLFSPVDLGSLLLETKKHSSLEQGRSSFFCNFGTLVSDSHCWNALGPFPLTASLVPTVLNFIIVLVIWSS